MMGNVDKVIADCVAKTKRLMQSCCDTYWKLYNVHDWNTHDAWIHQNSFNQALLIHEYERELRDIVKQLLGLIRINVMADAIKHIECKPMLWLADLYGAVKSLGFAAVQLYIPRDGMAMPHMKEMTTRKGRLQDYFTIRVKLAELNHKKRVTPRWNS